MRPLVRRAAIQSGSVGGGARAAAMAGYRDIRRLIAHAGVAAFGLSLLLPAVVPSALRPNGHTLVAATVDARTATDTVARVALADARALIVRPTPEPTPEPTPVPTPEPTPVPTATPIPRPVAVAGGQGVFVVASWYGPGFYENRLPCWPWLQANNLPIQFLPDTWGVAHKTLPCGTMLRLTYRGTTITVPVVDRGPYIAGRELDLSPRVKAALGCTDLCTLLMQIP